MNILDRFWAKVDKNTESGCWEWTGSLSKCGYGQFSVKGGTMSSHRVSYEFHHPITKPILHIKLCVCHTCDNPKCINPSHLWLGTIADNNFDKIQKNRHYKGRDK